MDEKMDRTTELALPPDTGAAAQAPAAPAAPSLTLDSAAQTAQEAQRHGIPVLIAEEATIPGLLRLAQTL